MNSSDDMLSGMPTAAEIRRCEQAAREFEIIQHQRRRADEELHDYHVPWGEITAEDVHALGDAIRNATSEEDLQRFLNANKQFLIQHLSGGHGRFVIPKPNLGGRFVPDYLVAHEDSAGLHWHGVELKPTTVQMFTKAGAPAARLTQAIQQISDWRGWLRENIAFAQKRTTKGGCGLVGISGDLSATILIGRRAQYPERFNEFRNQTEKDSRISIHSWDWLVDVSRDRAPTLKQRRERRAP